MTATARPAEVIPDELELISRLLPLSGAALLELGCGAGAMSRRLAMAGAACVVALEVTEQHVRRNRAAGEPAGLRFGLGHAEAIPLADGAVDAVLMLKSLHHVRTEAMAQALREVHRVLSPGGCLYVSEPVSAGGFNEVMRLFHNEEAVRLAAIAAIDAAVADGLFAVRESLTFLEPITYSGFADFDRRMLSRPQFRDAVTPALRARVQARFESFLSPAGVRFDRPVRVHLLLRRLLNAEVR